MKKTVIFFTLMGLITQLFAQELTREPYTYNPKIAAHFDLSENAAIDITPDSARMKKIDDFRAIDDIYTASFIFVNIDFKKKAQFVELDNGKLWVLVLKAQGANGMSFRFDSVQIPSGGELFTYNFAKDFYTGPYIDEDKNPANNHLTTWDAKGSIQVIEYFEPKIVIGKSNIYLLGYDYIFREMP